MQGDPRSELDALVYDEVLALFQPDLSDHFMFADGGCAVFMINHEDLINHDSLMYIIHGTVFKKSHVLFMAFS